MKVILSRKGFDSANGGILSPIFEDGTMLSFPIPGKDEEKDCIRYDELFCGNICLKRIMDDLKYRGAECCHLDPDLVKERKKRKTDSGMDTGFWPGQSIRSLLKESTYF